MYRNFRRLFFAASAALLMSSVAPARAVEIAVSNYGGTPGSMPWTIALQKGLFKKHGVDVTAIRATPGSAPAIRELIAGNLPYAEAGLTGAIAAIRGGADLRIVSTNAHTFAEVNWVALANSPIATIKDIKGKRVGFSTPKSSTHMAVLMMLKQAGISPSDVKLIAAGSFPQAMTALEAGGIDVVPMVDPNFSINGSKYKLVAKAIDVLPPISNLVGITTAAAAKNNPDMIKGIIAARREALDFLYANPKEASEILAPVYKLDAQVLEKVIIAMRDHGSIDAYPFLGAGDIKMKPLENALEGAKLTGELSEEFDVKSIIDESFLPEDLKGRPKS